MAAAATPRSFSSFSLVSYDSPSQLKPLPDLSYLAKLLLPQIYSDKLIQGRLLKEWKMLEEQVKTTVFKTALVYCKATKGILFKFLLKKLPNVQEVEVMDYFLRITFKDPSESSEKKETPSLKRSYSDQWEKELAPPHLNSVESSVASSPPGEDIKRQASHPPFVPPRKIFPALSRDKMVALHNFPSAPASRIHLNKRLSRNSSDPLPEGYYKKLMPADISEVTSAAIRFTTFDTSHYLDALQNIFIYMLKQASDTETSLNIALCNTDVLFFAHFLNSLYRKGSYPLIEWITLEPNYVIELKMKAFSDVKEAQQKIRKQKEKIRQEWVALHSEEKPQRGSLKALDFNLLDPSFLKDSSSPRDAFLSVSKALVRFRPPEKKSKRDYTKLELAEEKAHLKVHSSLKSPPQNLASSCSRVLPFELHSSAKLKSPPKPSLNPPEEQGHSKLHCSLKSPPQKLESPRSHIKPLELQSSLKTICPPKLSSGSGVHFTSDDSLKSPRSPRPHIKLSEHQSSENMALSHKVSSGSSLFLDNPPRPEDAKAYNWAITYLSYKWQYEPVGNHSGEKRRKVLWKEVRKDLPNSPLYKKKEHQREMLRLSELKSKIETAIYTLPHIVLSEEIPSISVYQSVRSFFPTESNIPVMSVWINGNPLEMTKLIEEKKTPTPIEVKPIPTRKQPIPKEHDPVSIYFNSLVCSLSQYQPETYIDSSEFVRRLFAVEDFTPFASNTHEEKTIVLILQTASASFMHHIFQAIKAITQTLPAGYTLQVTKPQPDLPCEIFLREDGDFAVIRTMSYTLLKEGEEAGELVVKWKVWRQKGEWGCRINIPVIDLADSIPLKELEIVYQALLSSLYPDKSGPSE